MLQPARCDAAITVARTYATCAYAVQAALLRLRYPAMCHLVHKWFDELEQQVFEAILLHGTIRLVSAKAEQTLRWHAACFASGELAVKSGKRRRSHERCGRGEAVYVRAFCKALIASAPVFSFSITDSHTRSHNALADEHHQNNQGQATGHDSRVG